MSINKKEVKDFINSWNEQNAQPFYETSKTIWENPELPMQEYKSSALLIDLLEKNGFNVEKGVAGMPTAFIASYGSGKPVIVDNSPTVMLLPAGIFGFLQDVDDYYYANT